MTAPRPGTPGAGLVVERHREALRGDSRTDDGTRAHRALLPGSEDELGTPHTPHGHP